jgi:hypothetical protein
LLTFFDRHEICFAYGEPGPELSSKELAMHMFKTGLLAAIVTGGLLFAAAPARADITFSGGGASGTLSSASETWWFNYDGGASVPGSLNNWGSPGVGAGTAYYGEASPAYGLTITFDGGGAINAASIITGNSAGCAGSTGGGTTFCALSPDALWLAFQTGPDTIQFLAPDTGSALALNHQYFVNIFFDGETPTSFSGAWLTELTAPPTGVTEPASLVLLGSGLLGLSLLRRRRG